MNSPKVSIVTPTYNRSQYIDGLVRTVFAQTYPDFELIIVDDGSQDDTRAVVEKHIAAHPQRIRYFYQENQGSAAARNRGIREAKGEIIAFLDSDDEWFPEFVTRVVNALAAGTHQWAVTAARKVTVDADGNEHDAVIETVDIQRHRELFDRELSVYDSLIVGNYLGGASRVAATREALVSVGGFREDLRLSQDYELWLRLAKSGYRLAIINDPLVLYRKTLDSVTKTRYMDALRCGYKIMTIYAPDAVRRDPGLNKLYARKFWDYAREIHHHPHADRKLFIKCILRSLWFKGRHALFGKRLPDGDRRRTLLLSFRGGLGDFLMLTPLLAAIQADERYRIVLVSESRHKFFLERYPYFDRIYYFDCPSKEQLAWCPRQRALLWWRLKMLGPDIALFPITSYGYIHDLICRYSAAALTIGFDHGRNTDRYMIKLPIDRERQDIEMNLEVCRYLDIAPAGPATYFPLEDEERTRARAAIAAEAGDDKLRLVAMAPTVKGMYGYPSRAWPVRCYAELTRRLLAEEGSGVLFFGSRPEVRLLAAHPEFAAFKDHPRVIWLTECPDLFSRAAALAECDVLVCSDAGPLHLAAALGVPIVSLWGPTRPERKGYCHLTNFCAITGDDCECAFDYGSPPVTCKVDEKCMSGITMETVEQAVRDVLSGRDKLPNSSR